jgi:D-serine deaminase-like pyridoxal phosphate-dependent protein
MTAPAHVLSIPNLSLDRYKIAETERVLTPALAIYPEVVDANIGITLRLLGGADRWRPHVKTTKLAYVMERMLKRGITNFKCSTTLELSTICELGATDVLLAYPVVGANARRVREAAAHFSPTRISALVENVEQIDAWREARVGLFIDINTGMDRTGIGEQRVYEIVALARAIESAGIRFRGLHYYDGHLSALDLPERNELAHRGYDRLMEIVAALDEAGVRVEEVITAGTPALPCTLSYEGFGAASFTHRASPGTVVYSDCASLAQLPAEWGYRPGALVISTVVSHPAPARLTCDAGHKTVSADAGVPTCAIIGWSDLLPCKPSEEHLPVEAHTDSALPAIGETLYLLPRHICPTVNNFDHAIIVVDGHAIAVERVTARGREAPLAKSSHIV